MYVLGVEAATSVASVALLKENILLAEFTLNNKRTHSTNLLPTIKYALECTETCSNELQGIAVSIGPGSFTGLRISLTTVKTLAQVWGLPVVGVGTLEALAYPWKGLERLICPVLNARKNEVYAALYKTEDYKLSTSLKNNGVKAFHGHSEGGLKCILEPIAISPVELASKLKRLNEPVLLTGDGALTYKKLFVDYLGGRAGFTPYELSLPRGAAVAGLGRRRLLANEADNLLLLTPMYVNLSEAEKKWLQKIKNTRET